MTSYSIVIVLLIRIYYTRIKAVKKIKAILSLSFLFRIGLQPTVKIDTPSQGVNWPGKKIQMVYLEPLKGLLPLSNLEGCWREALAELVPSTIDYGRTVAEINYSILGT